MTDSFRTISIDRFNEEATKSTKYGTQNRITLQRSPSKFKKMLMQRYSESSEEDIGAKLEQSKCLPPENNSNEVLSLHLGQIDSKVKDNDDLELDVQGSKHAKISQKREDLSEQFGNVVQLGSFPVDPTKARVFNMIPLNCSSKVLPQYIHDTCPFTNQLCQQKPMATDLTYETELINRKNVVSESRIYPYLQRGKGFSSRLASSNEKRYQCTHCQKTFSRKDGLKRHMLIHTNLKPHQCCQCGHFFARLDHLKSHMRTHLDRKPYECSYCGYRACRKDMITQNMITHM